MRGNLEAGLSCCRGLGYKHPGLLQGKSAVDANATRTCAAVVYLGSPAAAKPWNSGVASRLMNSEFSWCVLLIGLVIFVTAIATLLILVGLFAGHGASNA
jgi:hypothetical protein